MFVFSEILTLCAFKSLEHTCRSICYSRERHILYKCLNSARLGKKLSIFLTWRCLCFAGGVGQARDGAVEGGDCGEEEDHGWHDIQGDLQA
jgi:hypothetical protein